ncbi:aldose 1-epimerase family protein [Liquorilactobacillus satsumensis]|uniref:aldose 1-epimerase family protein n=1 Tax=Liquorilactobacillus satsumensis TaxID=259059 RepID=UPI0021C3931A|nr:aldose 1-epimerase family protein [Liquorilactobacillus satsumensis]MCP9327862.1 aldose 1-epimerase family protein [Liquorilactobacillus satsumensis]
MTVTLENNKLRVVFSEHGAEMVSLYGKEKQFEYLWQADPQYWGRHAPVLFPIVGRLQADHYRFAGQSYEMHQHGFARDQDFTVVKQTKTAVVFELKASSSTKEKYPFAFVLKLSYTLHAESVAVTYTVENPANQKSYFSIGGHPAFNLPMGDPQLDFADYHVELTPHKERQQISLVGNYTDVAHAVKTTTNDIALSHKLFAHDALIFNLQAEPTTLTLTDAAAHTGVTLRLENAEYCGIWSPYPAQAPFVCLEPWWGLADDVTARGELSTKNAIHALPAQTSFTGKYEISVF